MADQCRDKSDNNDKFNWNGKEDCGGISIRID